MANNNTKATKYKSIQVYIDGYCFASKVEGEYYKKLKKDKEEGKIKDFELQPVFLLQESFKVSKKTYKAITYKADFRVVNNDGSSFIVDIKGIETEAFKLKYKMYLYKYKEPIYLLNYVKKYGGWIETKVLKQKRKENKKSKK